nr:low-density lipoprotein receptor-related protein 8-like [Cherax quadricarinatus]
MCVKNKACIPLLWKCDNESDCIDGSDEYNCSVATTCLDHQYRCRSGRCISHALVCDDSLDCPDGDDEEQCSTLACMSDPKHFLCKSGTCLPREAACDGKDDCGDGSDEGGRCNETCKNCAYNCVKTPLGPRCSCLDGFKITSSGSCEDVDECQGNVSVCDHFCNNLKGSYQCQCHPQYELQPDNATCITKSKEPASLFFAQEKGVRLLSLDESFYRQIVTSDEVIVALAYDPEDKIFLEQSVGGLQSVAGQ